MGKSNNRRHHRNAKKNCKNCKHGHHGHKGHHGLCKKHGLLHKQASLVLCFALLVFLKGFMAGRVTK